MTRHRTAVTAAALALLVGLGAGCAEMTTTGVPAEDGSEATGDALAGTAWLLTSSSTPDLPVDDADITIAFQASQLSGQAPVNSYFAGYSVDGDRIDIGEIGITLKAGPEPLMAAEAAYTSVLASVTTFQVGEASLTLEAEGGEFLGYEPAVPSQGHGSDETEIPAETAALADSLVGMTVAQAEETAEAADLMFRVVSTDGKAAAVTQDYRTDRINVEVEDEVVVAATVG